MELFIGFAAGVVSALAGVYAGLRMVRPRQEAEKKTSGGGIPPLEADVLDEWLNGPRKKGR